ncbi:low molecular weight phosphatase family protein [Demequina sp. SO4-18]|uniref:arsenate reductase/protein-tyrosine-phosphatase family protein n=1 Tax=Demequina sp. SO4-18 TaxID=3401026 RepID=UPI003B5B3EB3
MANVLTVCTGNICRSPAAEALLRHHLGDLAEVSSAGTYAMTDTGIPAQMLMGLDASGIDARSHRSRQLTGPMAREADLIIAMTAEHRTRIVQEAPAVLRRTFLLDELAKAARAQAPLEGATAAERLSNVPDAIQGFRPELVGLGVEDVPDPYGRSQESYDRAYSMIEAAVRDISAWVRGEPVT